MNILSLGLVGLCLSVVAAENFCTIDKVEEVGRVVFGEAQGESATGQLAVAWTIVNRVHHPGYPNTLSGVVYQKYGSNHQYNTLDVAHHTTEWNNNKNANSTAYINAIVAAIGALCNGQADPTTCATDYCARDPCSATDSNQYWTAYHKQQIGHHWFVCRKPASD